MIQVVSLHKRYKLNEPLLKKIAANILKAIDKQGRRVLDIVFLDDTALKSLNKKYKDRDRLTDVLSFDLGDFGEIFISVDRAIANSKIFGTRIEEELVLYVIHGILHLYGYDDENVEDKTRMSAKESEILRLICRKEVLSTVLMPL